MAFCLQSYRDIPGCDAQWDAFNRCEARQPTSSYDCFGDVHAFDFTDACVPQFNAVIACGGG